MVTVAFFFVDHLVSIAVSLKPLHQGFSGKFNLCYTLQMKIWAYVLKE